MAFRAAAIATDSNFLFSDSRRALPENAGQVLNLVVLYVCLPAAVLRYVPRLHLEPALLAIAIVPWLLLLATLICVSALSRWLRFREEEHAALLLTVALGNTSFLGYPLTRALIGASGLPRKDAETCSKPMVYATSPLTSAATSSKR